MIAAVIILSAIVAALLVALVVVVSVAAGKIDAWKETHRYYTDRANHWFDDARANRGRAEHHRQRCRELRRKLREAKPAEGAPE